MSYCQSCADLLKQVDALQQMFRETWWLSHGCPIAALYGDDGEMQCGQCRVDFKRMPFDELKAWRHARQVERIAAAWRSFEKAGTADAVDPQASNRP